MNLNLMNRGQFFLAECQMDSSDIFPPKTLLFAGWTKENVSWMNHIDDFIYGKRESSDLDVITIVSHFTSYNEPS